MSNNIENIRVTCLLYLDDPEQAELSDHIGELTKFRRAGVLREILVRGWLEYKKEKNIGQENIENIRFSDKDEIKNTPIKRKKIKNNKDSDKIQKEINDNRNKTKEENVEKENKNNDSMEEKNVDEEEVQDSYNPFDKLRI